MTVRCSITRNNSPQTAATSCLIPNRVSRIGENGLLTRYPRGHCISVKRLNLDEITRLRIQYALDTSLQTRTRSGYMAHS